MGTSVATCTDHSDGEFRTPRKPPQSVVTKRRNARQYNPVLMQRICEQAAELFVHNDAREISHVIGVRFGISEATVDWYLTGALLMAQRDAASLRNGWKNAESIAAEARKAVWDVA